MEYVVKRELPNWEPCADGSGRTVTGHQLYRFFPVGDGGSVLPGSRVFGGFDQTKGESGGCSLNDTARDRSTVPAGETGRVNGMSECGGDPCQ